MVNLEAKQAALRRKHTRQTSPKQTFTAVAKRRLRGAVNSRIQLLVAHIFCVRSDAPIIGVGSAVLLGVQLARPHQEGAQQQAEGKHAQGDDEVHELLPGRKRERRPGRKFGQIHPLGGHLAYPSSVIAARGGAKRALEQAASSAARASGGVFGYTQFATMPPSKCGDKDMYLELARARVQTRCQTHVRSARKVGKRFVKFRATRTAGSTGQIEALWVRTEMLSLPGLTHTVRVAPPCVPGAVKD